MEIRLGQTANCYCGKCLFVGRLTTLTEARKEKKGYSSFFQIVTRKRGVQDGCGLRDEHSFRSPSFLLVTRRYK